MKQKMQTEKFKLMTETPIPKLVIMMAVPSVVSMLISALYNMVDTFFVGKISTQATGAIGIVFPYMALIQAIAFFFGHGSGNYISRELGKQNQKSAEKMATSAFTLTLMIGCAITVAGYFLMDPILRLLGSTDTMLQDARNYFRYILLSTPFLMTSLVLNNQMRFQGNANKSMFGIAAGAILNIVLDPIFIFVFHLGVSGAAIATAISQFTSFVLLYILNSQSDGIHIKFSTFSARLFVWREVTAGGLPSLGRQGLASVAVICLNNAVKPYGDSAIAAFSVVSRIAMISIAALIGFGQGFQPVCGFNYGARRFDRVRQAFWFTAKVASAVTLILGILGFIFAQPLVTAFRDSDPDLIRIGMTALRFQAVVFPLNGWIIVVNMYLQTIRKTIPATIMGTARQGIVFIPVLFITLNFGLHGIQMTQMISDIITFIISIPLVIPQLRLMKAEEKSTQIPGELAS